MALAFKWIKQILKVRMGSCKFVAYLLPVLPRLLCSVARPRILLLCMAAFLLMPVFANQALAQTPLPLGTCTSDPEYDIANPSNGGPQIFASIKRQMDNNLKPLAQLMFNNLLNKTNASGLSIRGAITAAVTLYILIYGVVFTFGMAQITVFDLMGRLVKLGIIGALLGSNAWGYFGAIIGGYNCPVDGGGNFSYDGFGNIICNATGFFEGGVDEIITDVTSVVVGGIAATQGSPFAVMDWSIDMLVSPKMAATMIAVFTTGPYSFGIGLVLFMSLTSFVKSLLNAMWVYIMAMVMRAFLYALAPFFIPCILFSRTRHLFDGWLNQIVNACLQPIFLFTFFSFFAVLIEACIDQLFSTPVCWTDMKDAFRGTPFQGQFWRFAVWDCTDSRWVPFTGVWGFAGPQEAVDSCATSASPVNVVHPLGITLPLTLWIISDLASRFNTVIIEVAKEISSASTDLSRGVERMTDWAASGGSKTAAPAAPQNAAGASGGFRTGTGGQVAGSDRFNQGFDQGHATGFSKGLTHGNSAGFSDAARAPKKR